MIIQSPYRVYIATVGVFLGAGIVSLGQRMLSVGLPDLRGALGLGFDEAAWIPTAYDMALMFMGPLTVYLGAVLGPRRVLLASAPFFALAWFLIPFLTNYPAIIALQVIAGLASGTFYPLSLSFALTNLPPQYTIYGIGAYSLELLTTLSIGTRLAGWLVEHASYRWFFWCEPLLALLMLPLIFFAVPNPAPRPKTTHKPKFVSFLFGSAGFALVYGTLEQGERLDWLNSPTIVAMLASGGFLLLAALVWHFIVPNPLVNLKVLWNRNALSLGIGLFSVRFVLLALLVLVPGFLGAVQGYRPLETGRVLMWSLVPLLIAGSLAARLMRRFDGRVVAALGFGLVGASALYNALLTSAWVDEDFFVSQTLLAAGLAFCLVSIVGMIGQQLQDSGAVTAAGVVRPVDVLTYAAFLQLDRLFGGQLGVTVVQRFVDLREKFHSNRLGYNVAAGNVATDEHLRTLTAGLSSVSPGLDDAQGRAVLLLGGELRREAFTLAYLDGFLLIVVVCILFMLVMAGMKPMKIYFDSAPAPALTPAKQTP